MENVDVIFSAHMVRDNEGDTHMDAAQFATQRLWEHQHGLGIKHSRAKQGRGRRSVIPAPQA